MSAEKKTKMQTKTLQLCVSVHVHYRKVVVSLLYHLDMILTQNLTEVLLMITVYTKQQWLLANSKLDFDITNIFFTNHISN